MANNDDLVNNFKMFVFKSDLNKYEIMKNMEQDFDK